MTTLTQNADAVHEFIANRRSARFYQSTPIDEGVLLRLLEAARWAASGRNRQPWNFIVATKDNHREYQRLLDCLGEGNQSWAHTAPVLMLVVALVEEDGAPIRTALYDTGLAVSSLTIQAMAEGLLLRNMGSFDRDRARQVYGIPTAYEPVVTLAIGYPADPASLTDEQREREQAPRTRKPLSEFVFSGQWGQPAALMAQKENA